MHFSFLFAMASGESGVRPGRQQWSSSHCAAKVGTGGPVPVHACCLRSAGSVHVGQLCQLLLDLRLLPVLSQVCAPLQLTSAVEVALVSQILVVFLFPILP